MTPRRQKRLALAACIVLGTAATAALTAAAFRENLLFFHTPAQVRTQAETIDFSRPFRLGGLVEEGSVRREPGALSVEFLLTDRAASVPVVYTGVLPDLFREGKGAVVRGQWRDDKMVADEVLAKHDENYAPPSP